jgi:hypothetical protein
MTPDYWVALLRDLFVLITGSAHVLTNVSPKLQGALELLHGKLLSASMLACPAQYQGQGQRLATPFAPSFLLLHQCLLPYCPWQTNAGY